MTARDMLLFIRDVITGEWHDPAIAEGLSTLYTCKRATKFVLKDGDGNRFVVTVEKSR